MKGTQWLQIAESRHRIVVITLMLISTFCFGFNVVRLTEDQQLIIALSCVALTGLSHGAVDHLVDGAVLKPIMPTPLLLLVYVALALLVVISWHVFPAASLLSFLILSVLHFGTDLDFSDYQSSASRWLNIVVRGSIPILIPCYAHQSEVGSYFRQLGCDMQTGDLHFALSFLFIAWILLTLTLLTARAVKGQRFNHRGELFESITLAAMCWLLPPLVSFAIYFCALHSLRQILRLSFYFDPLDSLNGFKKFLIASAPLTLASVAGSVLIFLIQPNLAQISTTEIRTLFISLAALALPHMMLGCAADILRSRENSSPDNALLTDF